MQRSVVGEEDGLSLELYDGGMGRVAVAGYFGKHALVLVWAVNLVAHGVTNLFWPPFRKGEVVLAVMLVYPRCFGKLCSCDWNFLYFAINLYHVFLEFGDVALAVTP